MLPNVTNDSTKTEVEPYKAGQLDAYVTYCALGGLITEDDGAVSRMSIDEFCQHYGVTRMTLNRWKKQIPDWPLRVAARRDEIMPLARVTAVWNSVYSLARQTKDRRAAVNAAKLFLGHNGLQLPVQRQDIKVQGGLMEILEAAERDGIIEGEVIEPKAVDTGTSSQAPGTLPNPS